MNYDDIFLFVKLINVGTFSGLAKALNTTQGTISKRIQRLEEQLNLQLIHRNSRTLETTVEGRLLYDKFNHYEVDLKDSLEDVINKQSRISGILKISIPKVVSDKILMPYFHEFKEKYPEAQIIISYNANKVDLLKEGLNLAISMQQPDSINNKIKLLKKSRIKLFTTEAYRERYGLPQTLDDLSQHNLIGYAQNNVSIPELLATNIHNDTDELIPIKPNVYVNNAIHNIDMAYSGDFITNVAEFLINRELITGKLIPVLPDYYFGKVNFYLIRGNEIHSKLEQVFVNFIENCFTRNIE